MLEEEGGVWREDRCWVPIKMSSLISETATCSRVRREGDTSLWTSRPGNLDPAATLPLLIPPPPAQILTSQPQPEVWTGLSPTKVDFKSLFFWWGGGVGSFLHIRFGQQESFLLLPLWFLEPKMCIWKVGYFYTACICRNYCFSASLVFSKKIF